MSIKPISNSQICGTSCVVVQVRSADGAKQYHPTTFWWCAKNWTTLSLPFKKREFNAPFTLIRRDTVTDPETV